MSISEMILNAWHDSTGVAKFIVILIGFLLLATTVAFFKHWARYGREKDAIDKTGKSVLDWFSSDPVSEEDEESSQEDLPAIPRSIPIDHLLEQLKSPSLLKTRLTLLQQLQLSKVKIDVKILQHLSIASESKQWSAKLPSFASSFAMLLGMFGTFLGLTLMVAQIGQELQGLESVDEGGMKALENSFAGIKGIMGGVGTAFYTTLAGLVCTLLVTGYNFLLEQRKAALFEYLEAFTSGVLLPKAFPNLEEGEMLDRISDRLEDAFEGLNETLERNNHTLANIDGLYQKFDQIVLRVKEITQGDTSTQVQQLILEMTNLLASIEKISEKYENKKILQEITSLEESNRSFVSRYNRLIVDANWIPGTKRFMIINLALLALIAGALGFYIFK